MATKRKSGPAFFKNGRAVRYLVSDLDRWLMANRIGGGAPAPDPASPPSTRFLTSQEAANYIGMSEGWLRQTRVAGNLEQAEDAV